MKETYDKDYGDSNYKQPDVHFISAGGKHKMHKIAQALLKIGQKTLAIIDFDFFNDGDKTKNLYKMFGGNWVNINSMYTAMTAAVKKIPEKSLHEVIAGIEDFKIQIQHAGEVKRHHKNQIHELLDSKKPWGKAKQEGLDAFSNDADKLNATALLDAFSDRGIWIVPTGELESFDKSINKHGIEWVISALDKNSTNLGQLEQAKCFMRKILRSCLH